METMRLTSLTAGPITVKSSRSVAFDVPVKDVTHMQAEANGRDGTSLRLTAGIQFGEPQFISRAACSALAAAASVA